MSGSAAAAAAEATKVETDGNANDAEPPQQNFEEISILLNPSTLQSSIESRIELLDGSSNSSVAYPDVTLSMKLHSVSDIEISSSRFEATIWFRMQWENELQLKAADGTVWIPEPIFTNATKKDILVDRLHRKHHRWFREIKMHGVFRTNFLMQNFPFDTQQLKIEWESSDNFNFINVQASVAEQLELVEYDLEVRSEVYRKCSDFAFLIHIRRKYSFYLKNVFFILFLIGTISLASFFLSNTDFEKRLGLCVMLFFTIVTMMRNHASATKVSYFTVLHLYYLSCIGWVFLTGVCNLLVTEGQLSDPDEFNLICLLVATSIWMGFHLIAGTYFLLWHTVGCRSPYQMVSHRRDPRRQYRSAKHYADLYRDVAPPPLTFLGEVSASANPPHPEPECLEAVVCVTANAASAGAPEARPPRHLFAKRTPISFEGVGEDLAVAKTRELIQPMRWTEPPPPQ